MNSPFPKTLKLYHPNEASKQTTVTFGYGINVTQHRYLLLKVIATVIFHIRSF